MQRTDDPGSVGPPLARPSYARLVAAISADPAAIVEAVARDVAGPDEPRAEVEAEVRPAVERLLAVLREGGDPSPDVVAGLRDEGAEAARAGVSVERAIDRYLSAGWVIWAAAAGRAAERGRGVSRVAFVELGAALLRVGDLAAAAIADGHGSAAEEAAGRAATARAELLDELLEGPATPEATARAGRHALALGLDPAGPFDVIVAVGVGGAGGAEPDAEAAGAILLRRPRPGRRAVRPSGALVGQRGSRLILVSAGDLPIDAAAAALGAALPGGWHAARSASGGGPAGVRAAYLEASSALVAVARSRAPGRIVPAAEVLVERTLLADESILRAMVEGVLGPLAGAPRGGPELLDTLAAWLDARMNAQATARALRVAPRTVAYRLARVERLTGRRLDGAEAARLSAALLGRRLLVDPGTSTAG